MTESYDAFLERKSKLSMSTGIIDIPEMPEFMFDYQKAITRWALRRGRAAVFAGTGTGKTVMELVYGNAVANHTGLPVLLMAPLAVSAQMIREAEKFGLSARIVKTQDEVRPGVNVTNYQKMDHFDFESFGGVILDESSILKSEAGKYRTKLINECSKVPFRLSATATPAPNDFMELGNQAEFVGALSYMDMLARFFTHDGSDTQKWILKGHAQSDFWKWMCSWSVLLRKPSDLGFDDSRHILPPLIRKQHVVTSEFVPNFEEGLFSTDGKSLKARRVIKRTSLEDRVAMAASITPTDEPVMWWCHLNDESAALAKAIPGAVEVTGSDSDDYKEQKLLDFAEGKIRVVISKPSICGHGMNFQVCAWTGFVGLNDSFEQTFQAIRRFWRFGQTRPVQVHLISSDREGAVLSNLQRKEDDADRMAEQMVRHMADISSAEIRGISKMESKYHPTKSMTLPSWLRSA